MRHIISLSTIPPRFAEIGPTLRSLVRQRSRPEAVELYIPNHYRRFPEWGGGLPDVPDGVTIVRTDEDMGPATKVLPAVQAYKGQDLEVIYVDDDRIFSPGWTRLCLKLRKDHPRTAICGAGFSIQERYGYRFPETPLPRAVAAPDSRDQFRYQLRRLVKAALHRSGRDLKLSSYARRFDRSGYTDIAEGYGGVMVRPDFLDAEVFNIPALSWAVDDIWLSGSLVRQGIPIWADRSLYRATEITDLSLHNAPLHKAIIEGAGREQANRAAIEHMQAVYGIWGGVAVQST